MLRRTEGVFDMYDLTVFYQGFAHEMDDQICAMAGEAHSSGFNFLGDMRDLAFEFETLEAAREVEDELRSRCPGIDHIDIRKRD
jgi:hypothetical protein